MKLSRALLEKFVDLGRISNAEIADRLTRQVAEVEGVERHPAAQPAIVVGEILAVEPHPDADRLKVCRVEVGRPEPVTIVCGGVNVRAGLRVGVALPGARVRWHGEGDPVVLAAAKLRGVESFGMICSAAELEISDLVGEISADETFEKKPAPDGEISPEKIAVEPTEKGIAELRTDAAPGTPLAEAFPQLADAVFEIENKSITHRPDLFSHRGIARELGAIFDRKFLGEIPENPDCPVGVAPHFLPKFLGENVPTPPDHKISFGEILGEIDPAICREYFGAKITGGRVADAPERIRAALAAVGEKSISGPVDLSNFLMIALGAPTHIFDADKIRGKISVRRARSGEKLLTLKNETVELGPENIVIADEAGALALAGVIGGLDSAVSPGTTNFLVEAANFDPALVRRSAAAAGIRTEASTRFEKDQPVIFAREAMAEILAAVPAIFGENAAVAAWDLVANGARADRAPALPAREISVPAEIFAEKIGDEISPADAAETLKKIGFAVKIDGENLTARVPDFRPEKDISIPEDLVEEVARLRGFDRIPEAAPRVRMTPPPANFARDFARGAEDFFAGAGFFVTPLYAFCSEKTLKNLGIPATDLVKIQNPLGADTAILSPDSAAQTVPIIAKNWRETPDGAIFAADKIWRAAGKNPGPGAGEIEIFAGAAWGAGAFFRLRDTIRDFFRAVPAVKFVPADRPTRPYFSTEIEIFVDKKSVGRIGILAESARAAWKIRAEAATFEIEIAPVRDAAAAAKKVFAPWPETPGAARDFSFLVPEKTRAAEVKIALEKSAGAALRVAEILSVFRDKKSLPAGQKVVTARAVFGATDRTLTDAEIAEIEKKILNAAEKNGWTRR